MSDTILQRLGLTLTKVGSLLLAAKPAEQKPTEAPPITEHRAGTGPSSRYSLEQAKTIREERAAGASISDLARRWRSSQSHISRICSGADYQAAGGPITGRKCPRIDALKTIEVMALHKHGMSYTEIARIVGIDRASVARRIRSDMAAKEDAR